jgi:hypothetical protein
MYIVVMYFLYLFPFYEPVDPSLPSLTYLLIYYFPGASDIALSIPLSSQKCPFPILFTLRFLKIQLEYLQRILFVLGLYGLHDCDLLTLALNNT